MSGAVNERSLLPLLLLLLVLVLLLMLLLLLLLLLSLLLPGRPKPNSKYLFSIGQAVFRSGHLVMMLRGGASTDGWNCWCACVRAAQA